MLDFSPLFKTMKDKKVSTYKLIKKSNFSPGTIYRLKANGVVSSTTINNLCKCLNCNLDDVVRYVPDDIYNENVLDFDDNAEIDLTTELEALKNKLKSDLDYQKNEQKSLINKYESKINELLEKLEKKENE